MWSQILHLEKNGSRGWKTGNTEREKSKLNDRAITFFSKKIYFHYDYLFISWNESLYMYPGLFVKYKGNVTRLAVRQSYLPRKKTVTHHTPNLPSPMKDAAGAGRAK